MTSLFRFDNRVKSFGWIKTLKKADSLEVLFSSYWSEIRIYRIMGTPPEERGHRVQQRLPVDSRQYFQEMVKALPAPI